jgi:choline dehydrogenase-like flavoprotein
MFFVRRWLRHAPERARALVLERGPRRDHAWRLQQHPEDTLLDAALASVGGASPGKARRAKGKPRPKAWKFAHALGGTSNLWWGNTPRLLPNDFTLKSTYGVGRDWPLRYDDLEAHYCEVEDAMGVAGDSVRTPFRRSRPYPLPAHHLGGVGRALAEAYPESFFAVPSARPTKAVGKRPACCGSGVCGRCPIDAKFTVLNGLSEVFADARLEVRVDAAVAEIEHRGTTATGVRLSDGTRIRADLVAVGAGAIHNPYLLLRSGFTHPRLGRGLFEQASLQATVDFDGLDNFDGTTSITGHGYLLYDGPHRRHHAAALIETWDAPSIRLDAGRWRQRARVQVIYEDLPREGNRVIVDPKDERRARIEFQTRTDYVERARKRARDDLERFLGPLPVEEIRWRYGGHFRDTEGHALGTTRMSKTLAHGIVDADLRHHRVRNLLVLGGSTFPTGSPANPTLTIAALSDRAASRLFVGA